MEEVIDVSGKQNWGARNFARQALLDKNPHINNENSLSIKAMVRLAGAGHEVPAPASLSKSSPPMPPQYLLYALLDIVITFC